MKLQNELVSNLGSTVFVGTQRLRVKTSSSQLSLLLKYLITDFCSVRLLLEMNLLKFVKLSNVYKTFFLETKKT